MATRCTACGITDGHADDCPIERPAAPSPPDACPYCAAPGKAIKAAERLPVGTWTCGGCGATWRRRKPRPSQGLGPITVNGPALEIARVTLRDHVIFIAQAVQHREGIKAPDALRKVQDVFAAIDKILDDGWRSPETPGGS